MNVKPSISGRAKTDLTNQYRWYLDNAGEAVAQRFPAEFGVQLEQEFGRGFGEKNLRRLVQFAEAFPDSKIVVSLLRQLGWTHFLGVTTSRTNPASMS